ncbi:MAG TPA: hypothetical protein VEU47_03360 [Candidatus Cybelea sp.]|nr:hypothetical protein [Candidatus Cybelea sp.]
MRGTDPHRFGICFGAFLIACATIMLPNPGLVVRRANRLADAACRALGGVTRGAIAFPDAAPTFWCGVRGLPKNVQRGVVLIFMIASGASLLFQPTLV